MRAQQRARAVSARRKIKRVVILARGMIGRNVELIEIHVVRFDIRAFGDGKSHVGENLDQLVHHLLTRDECGRDSQRPNAQAA